MDRMIADIITDPATRNVVFGKDIQYREGRIRDTRLEDYYTKEPSVNISEWTYKVKEKIRKYIDSAERL